MAQGVFNNMTSSWVDSYGNSGNGGYCSGEITWESTWQYDNVHRMTLIVRGIRTDGYDSASMWGDAIVDGEYISLGDHKVGFEPSFDEVSFDVETDDYGKLLTSVKVSIGFYSSASREEYWADADLTGITLDQPQKSVDINCPSGIICTIDKSPLYVGDQFTISITVTGVQWSDSPIVSVTGATKLDGLTYKATGNVYIVVTGVLAKHTIHISEGAGVNVNVIDELSGYSYSDGSVVDHYTIITITCSVESGYNLSQITINGDKHNNGVSIEVTSDIQITVTSEALGLARIFTGTTFDSFHVYIYNGTSWGMYIPLIFDGTSWNICA